MLTWKQLLALLEMWHPSSFVVLLKGGYMSVFKNEGRLTVYHKSSSCLIKASVHLIVHLSLAGHMLLYCSTLRCGKRVRTLHLMQGINRHCLAVYVLFLQDELLWPLYCNFLLQPERWASPINSTNIYRKNRIQCLKSNFKWKNLLRAMEKMFPAWDPFSCSYRHLHPQ